LALHAPSSAYAQTPQPTPAPTPAPALLPPAPRTLDVLRARIADVLARPELAPAYFSIKVVSLDTGVVVFEHDAQKLMSPASNMKLYTTAAALDRLGPDFRFVTSVYADAKPDGRGRIKGDLVIYGRGDPSFATRFAGNGDYFKAIDELAARVVAAGVKRVDGNLVGDESYFTGASLGAGWEWDDLQWYYGAPVSALTINDNAVDIFVKPAEREGAAAAVTTGPAFAGFPTIFPGVTDEQTLKRDASPLAVVNRVITSARGAKREIEVERPLGESYVEVSGTIPVGDAGWTESITTPRPALLFASMLRASLERRGVVIRGRTQALDAHARELLRLPFDAARMVEIARRESPPFSEVVAQTLKPSQNLYTELILRTLGKQSPPPTNAAEAAHETQTSPPQSSPQVAQPQPTPDRRPSAQLGSAAVRQFLREANVAGADRLSLLDGSGLARQDLVSAEATVDLLTYMSRHRYAKVFYDALPIAGVDGTLRGRMKNTPAQGNLRAKTGTLNNVSSVSGYVTTAAGEHLVFSMMVNHYTDERTPRTNLMDQIGVLLASFAGRTQ
ncbi:MAG: D-alanyl-D-alanine carboxypeptidase/D-alanyl-D-alanine-endopeptidase, partial [Acidobacteria bacterium]|nr:D-alanyl-D-alanine carboxypeptidase/D-alanyl-D-alanine-endopeptidase [Acidobacteriota bacterium]